MTTKTIPADLEGERQKNRDNQQRVEEEAARIQPLNHGHHRPAKQSKLELPVAVGGAPKTRRAVASGSSEEAKHRTKDGYKSPQGGMTAQLRSQP